MKRAIAVSPNAAPLITSDRPAPLGVEVDVGEALDDEGEPVPELFPVGEAAVLVFIPDGTALVPLGTGVVDDEEFPPVGKFDRDMVVQAAPELDEALPVWLYGRKDSLLAAVSWTRAEVLAA